MAPVKTILFAASAVIGASLVSAQAAPNWENFPKNCASQCADTIETSYLCQNQYEGFYASIYGCFCNAYPSDADACVTCLNANEAGALGKLLASTKSDCPASIKECRAECAITQCPSTDVACQCSPGYLQDIHDCGACNTNNGNKQATQLSDWTALRNSCADQKYAGADATFGTRPKLQPSGQSAYKAPTLTATGGGVAATGDIGDLAQTGPAPTSRRPVVTQAGTAGGSGSAASPTAGAGSAAASASPRAGASAGSGSGSGSGAASAGSSGARSGSGAAASAGAAASGATTGGSQTGTAPLVAVSRGTNDAAHMFAAPATGLLAVLGAAVALL